MQTQTKLAVGIGAALIGLGTWYMASPPQNKPVPTASTQEPAETKLTVAEPIAPPARLEEKPVKDVMPLKTEPATPIAAASTQPSLSGVASPAPQVTKMPIPEERARPEPLATDAPAPLINTSALPERAGLSSIAPSIPPIAKEPAPVAKVDMPPNIEKASAPSVAKSSTAASKPSDTAKRNNGSTPVAAAIGKPGAAGTRIHVVQAGDTYTSLAVKYFGHARYASQIIKANPSRDAKKLYVGAKIQIPDVPADTATATPKPGTTSATAKPAKGKAAREPVAPPDPARAYTVQPGEGWMDLARRFLGDSKDYPELYELNKERVGGNPHVLPAGTVIELPKRAKLSTAKPATETNTTKPVAKPAAETKSAAKPVAVTPAKPAAK